MIITKFQKQPKLYMAIVQLQKHIEFDIIS